MTLHNYFVVNQITKNYVGNQLKVSRFFCIPLQNTQIFGRQIHI